MDTKFPLELQYMADDGGWSSCLLDDQLTFSARITQVFATRARLVSSPDDADIIICNQKVYIRFSMTTQDGGFYRVRMHGSKRGGNEVKMRVIANDQQNAIIAGLRFDNDQFVIPGNC